MNRVSAGIEKINLYAGLIFQIIVGIVFLTGGVIITARAVNHEPHDTKLLWTGLGCAVGGAFVLPGLFTVIRPIFIMVFPNGLPLLGGRRNTDPPLPPPAV